MVYWLLLELVLLYELVLLDFEVCEYKMVDYFVLNLVGVVFMLVLDG